MKRVMLFVLMAIFSTVMFAQTQNEAKPATHKKRTHKTEMKAPAKEVKPAAQPAVKKEEPKPAAKKEVAKPIKK